MEPSKAPIAPTYRCSVCKKVYEFGNDEEALDELATNFPGTSVDECGIVCDDCYKKMGLGT